MNYFSIAFVAALGWECGQFVYEFCLKLILELIPKKFERRENESLRECMDRLKREG